jgi:hypothetical protein
MPEILKQNNVIAVISACADALSDWCVAVELGEAGYLQIVKFSDAILSLDVVLRDHMQEITRLNA